MATYNPGEDNDIKIYSPAQGDTLVWNTAFRVGKQVTNSFACYLRFPGIALGGTLVADTVILRAQYYGTFGLGFTTYGRIYGVMQLSPSQQTSYAAMDALPKTTAYVDWTLPGGAEFEWVETPDLKAIIDEITGQDGWSSGSPIMLLIYDNATPDGTYHLLRARYDDNMILGPQFVVTYQDVTVAVSEMPVNVQGLAVFRGDVQIDAAASIAVDAHVPRRWNDIPGASVSAMPVMPGWGAGRAYIPAKEITLTPKSLIWNWSVPVSLYPALGTIYICTLTGAADGEDDIEFPISSFQGLLRDGEPSYLSCIIPNGSRYYDEILARQHGEIVVKRGYILRNGTVPMQEIARVDFETPRLDKGPRSDSLTLAGHATVTASVSSATELRNIISDGMQANGKRIYRAPVNMFLRPGDAIVVDEEEIDIGIISYRVGPRAEYMEVTET